MSAAAAPATRRSIAACMIRVQPKGNQVGSAVEETIKQKLGTGYSFRNAQVIGPKVSHELLQDGITATILAVVMISVYVAVRFEWQYGVGALIATGHDVFVTAGFYPSWAGSASISTSPSNTVAALLAAGGLFDQRHGGGVRPHPREPAQVQAHAAART